MKTNPIGIVYMNNLIISYSLFQKAINNKKILEYCTISYKTNYRQPIYYNYYSLYSFENEYINC